MAEYKAQVQREKLEAEQAKKREGSQPNGNEKKVRLIQIFGVILVKSPVIIQIGAGRI